jgi:hypothetical protein
MMAKKDKAAGKNEEQKLACGRLKQQLAEVEKERDRLERNYSDTIHNHFSVLASLDCCLIKLSENLVIQRAWNSYNVFHGFVEGRHILEALAPDWAEHYFSELFSLRDTILAIAGKNEDRGWDTVFESAGGNLAGWVAYPSVRDWVIEDDRASVANTPAGRYLISPVELVGPWDDFRIEYTAIAHTRPSDLSVVVGVGLVAQEGGRPAQIPEDGGYCFAFGAHNNTCSQLQRLERPVWQSEISIVQECAHKCVAERSGGRFRFYVDGEMVMEYVDLLPLVPPHSGYVALYTYGAAHEFRSVKVSTRTCSLSEDFRREITQSRHRVLEVKGNEPRFIETSYLGQDHMGVRERSHMFLLKDVTNLVFAGRKIAEQTINAELAEKAMKKETTRLQLVEEHQAVLVSETRTIVDVTDELAACGDVKSLLRRAVELGREKLHLERCAIFLPDGENMRGSYGTNMQGETTDEHEILFKKDEWWYERFRHLHPSEPHWDWVEGPQTEAHGDKVTEVGRGWIAVTPIRAGKEILGLFFNDAAISGTKLDPIVQDIVEVYCSILGSLVRHIQLEEELAQMKRA